MNAVMTYLDAKNAEDDEECTADEDDVSDWTKRRQERLNDEFQTRSSTDHTEKWSKNVIPDVKGQI